MSVRPLLLCITGLLVVLASHCGPPKIEVQETPKGTCDYFDKNVERIWSFEEKNSVETAVGHFGSSSSGTVSQKIITKMDNALEDWVYRREAACNDCYRAGGGSFNEVYLYNLKSNCFDESLAYHRALAGFLTNADPKVAENAVPTITELAKELRSCLDEAVDKWRREVASNSVDSTSAEDETDPEMARAKVARYLGKEEEARQATEQAMNQARRAGDAQKEARVLVEQAEIDNEFARHKEAYAKFEKAFNMYAAIGDMLGAAEAGMGLAKVLTERAHYADAMIWYVKIEAVYLDAVGPVSLEYVRLLLDYAEVLHEVGRYPESFAFAHKAFEILVQVYGEGEANIELAHCLNIFGVEASYNGDIALAVTLTGEAVAMYSKIYSMGHKDVALNMGNLASMYRDAEEYDRALQYAEKARGIMTELYGYYHPHVSDYLDIIGSIWAAQNDLVKAKQYYDMALKNRVDAYGEQHPDVAWTFSQIGNLYHQDQQYQEAYNYHKAALDTYLAVFSEDHAFVAMEYIGMGRAFQAAGQNEEAIEYFDTAIEIYTGAYGNESTQAAWGMVDRGLSYRALGKKKKFCKDVVTGYDTLAQTLGHDHHYLAWMPEVMAECK